MPKCNLPIVSLILTTGHRPLITVFRHLLSVLRPLSSDSHSPQSKTQNQTSKIKNLKSPPSHFPTFSPSHHFRLVHVHLHVHAHFPTFPSPPSSVLSPQSSGIRPPSSDYRPPTTFAPSHFHTFVPSHLFDRPSCLPFRFSAFCPPSSVIRHPSSVPISYLLSAISYNPPLRSISLPDTCTYNAFTFAIIGRSAIFPS